jgi:hypothetical protein
LFDPAAIDPAVGFLASLAGSGAALELGIGTGRLAIPGGPEDSRGPGRLGRLHPGWYGVRPRWCSSSCHGETVTVSPEGAVPFMRHYEMMIILDPSLEENTVQPSLSSS